MFSFKVPHLYVTMIVIIKLVRNRKEIRLLRMFLNTETIVTLHGISVCSSVVPNLFVIR